jgi:hypothetical protein
MFTPVLIINGKVIQGMGLAPRQSYHRNSAAVLAPC